MKTALVIPSIQKLDNLRSFDLKDIDLVIIIDEGDEKLRDYNEKILEGMDYEFLGPGERGGIFGKDVDVIPIRCHAETSAGFYYAYQCDIDVVIELDDDCWGVDVKYLEAPHLYNLAKTKGIRVETKNNWYNPLDNMGKFLLFPRGYPYEPKLRDDFAEEHDFTGETILNMGLWSGQPDLDAVTILSHGGLNGKTEQIRNMLTERKIVVGKNIFFPICSMNTAFRAEIIPAFYQMYMNYEGLDRYCDIWSGLFIKKIADHLGKNVSLGQPVVEHRKTERSTFRDLRAEHEGMAINETLWKVIRDMQLEGKNYRDAYSSLVSELTGSILDGKFPDKLHNKMMRKQIDAMTQWLELFQ